MRLHRKGLGKHFKNGLSIIKAKHVYYTKLGKKKKKKQQTRRAGEIAHNVITSITPTNHS